MNKLVDRFIQYVKIDTQSDSTSYSTPSTEKQLNLANILITELKELNLEAISLDEHGYIMAKLPSNSEKNIPAIGFISHMDTAQDATGRNVNPQIIRNYQGQDIALGKSGAILSPQLYPELLALKYQDLITTDGKTLLGADDKAGIAEIMTAIAYLQEHKEIKHGDIWIGFTPDEEIGRGADLFVREKFAAQWAYTIDGGALGELEFENFNAAAATVICQGNNVHPGMAKNKMTNATRIAAQFILSMPCNQTPEQTEGYEGFYHLTHMEGGVAKTTLHYILRDFERSGLEARKHFIAQQVEKLNTQLKTGKITVEIADNYYNMKEKITPFPHIIDIAKKAMLQASVTPDIKPIRGGTDGARLSFMGLPCPNLFTGGANYHGIHEYVCIQSMEKSVEVIVNIVKLTTKHENR